VAFFLDEPGSRRLWTEKAFAASTLELRIETGAFLTVS
jgi:hypothetical protein